MNRCVVRTGDDVVGWGHLVRGRHSDWFGPPLATRLIVEPVRHSFLAVRVSGIDIEDVDDRRADEHGTTGTATVRGTWLGDRIEVHDQQRGCPPWATRSYPSWDDPPCAPPPTGWPHVPTGGNLRFDCGDLETTGDAVAVCTFRPTSTTAVLVVTAADPARVETQLRPQLGDALCVVPSRFTRPQLQNARTVIDQHATSWGGYSWGETVDAAGQAVLTADIVMISEEIAAQVGELPAGIVDVHPWLRPSASTLADTGTSSQ